MTVSKVGLNFRVFLGRSRTNSQSSYITMFNELLYYQQQMFLSITQLLFSSEGLLNLLGLIVSVQSWIKLLQEHKRPLILTGF